MHACERAPCFCWGGEGEAIVHAAKTKQSNFTVLCAGPYSAQILGHLLAAHRVNAEHVGEPGVRELRSRYKSAFLKLAFEHGYARNMVNIVAQTPDKVQYGDVDHDFLAFYEMGHACRPGIAAKIKNKSRQTRSIHGGADQGALAATKEAEEETLALCAAVAPWVHRSLELMYDSIKHAHSAPWDFIYGTFASRNFGGVSMKESRGGGSTYNWWGSGVGGLVDYPEEIILWDVDNTKRADLTSDANLLPTLNVSKTSIRRSESGALDWEENPFSFSWEGGGMSEENPTMFLLPYWLGRFHGFVGAGD